jgi:hypothetical protein
MSRISRAIGVFTNTYINFLNNYWVIKGYASVC